MDGAGHGNRTHNARRSTQDLGQRIPYTLARQNTTLTTAEINRKAPNRIERLAAFTMVNTATRTRMRLDGTLDGKKTFSTSRQGTSSAEWVESSCIAGAAYEERCNGT